MKKGMTFLIVFLVGMLIVSCSSTKPAASAKVEGAVVSAETVETKEPAVQTSTPMELEVADPAEVAQDTSTWKSAKSDIQISSLGMIEGMNIAKYRLRGEGPDGASFDWIDVTSTKVALSDIRRGQWKIYAQAIGENGDVLAYGTMETFLSENSPLGAVYLDPSYGVGDIACMFSWSPEQVIKPSLELYVKEVNGEFAPRDARELLIQNGLATWNVENMKAGSYVVRAVLKDDGYPVAGSAAALRVLDNKRSVGNIKLTVGKLAQVYGLSLENTPVATIVGSLEVRDKAIEFKSDTEGLHYGWFIDGEYVANTDKAVLDVEELGLRKGGYRVDCVVNNENITSVNCMSVYVNYADGVLRQIEATEMEGKRGDVPAGYTWFTTKDEEGSSVPVETKGAVEEPKAEEVAETEMEEAEPQEVVENFVIEEDAVEESVVVAEEAEEVPLVMEAKSMGKCNCPEPCENPCPKCVARAVEG